ncbi:hypothetical protein F9K73_20525 [Brucella intermedia]|nr:hypothetical protein F9K73_20525 [Brucella intermedia]
MLLAGTFSSLDVELDSDHREKRHRRSAVLPFCRIGECLFLLLQNHHSVALRQFRFRLTSLPFRALVRRNDWY